MADPDIPQDNDNPGRIPHSEGMLRENIIGMGKFSMRKNYYPAFKRRLDELERYKSLMDKAHDGIFIVELGNLHFIEANSATCAYLGHHKTELLDMKLDEVLAGAWGSELDEWIKHEDSTSQYFTFTLNHILPDSTSRYLEISLSFIDGKQDSCVFGLVRDISELVRINNELKEAHHIQTAIFDNSFQFMGLLDTLGRLIVVNMTALDAAGCKEAEVLNKYFWDTPWFDGLPDEQKRLRESFDRCLAGGLARYEMPNIVDGGQRVDVDFSMKPVFDEGGRVIYLIVEGRDITELKKMENQLIHSQKVDSLGRLAGGVAHDFKNLLGSIVGAVDLLLLDKSLNPEQVELLGIIQGASTSASELTSKLLGFARKEKVMSSPIDLHAVIEDAVLLLSRSIDKLYSLKMNLASTRSTIIGDPTQLENAIINLGLNARDSMPSGGEILISTSECHFDSVFCHQSEFSLSPGDYIELCFRDSGVGMPSDILQNIFEPFFTTKANGKGTGLGLATVYSTVVSHKGAVEVHSEIDKGTCFYLYFPLEEDYGSISIDFQSSSHNATVAGGLVLLVDDEPLMRSTSAMMLESMGYSVVCAENGAEAIEVYNQGQDTIDAVILDMIMPKLSGEDTMKEILRINPAAKIIISSGFDENADQRTETLSKAVGFLHKPYGMHELRLAVEKAIC